MRCEARRCNRRRRRKEKEERIEERKRKRREMKEGRAQIVGEGEEGGRKKEVVEFKSRREDGR
jgi:hypothetical protein